MARVYYVRWTTTNKGKKLFPKARRKGQNVAYCEEVSRVDGVLRSHYLSIHRVPDGVQVVTIGQPPLPEPGSHDPGFNTNQADRDGR